MDITISLVAVVLLLAANAFFVAAEFALVKARGFRIEALAEQGIALGEAMVGEHRQGFAGNGDGQPGQRGAAPGGDGLAGEPAATEESVPVSRIMGADTGGVDLYA